MTPNLTDFDEILDECLLAVASGQMSVEDCLHRYPQVAAQLEPLLQTAVQVRTLPRPPGLDAEKRRAIEQQLLNRAVQFKAPIAPRPSQRPASKSLRLRWGWVALVCFVLFIGGTGLVTASAGSLPSDALYPVKRLAEQISVATTSGADQVNLRVDLARRRLDEFEALAKRDDVRPELMTEALNEMATALQAAAALPDEQRQQVADAIVRLTDVHLALAASTSPRASLATRASLEASVAAAETARAQALQLADVQPPAEAATLAAPTATDLPTVEAHLDPTETSSAVPTLTGTSPLPTATVTAKPNLPAVKPTDKPTNTPRPPNTPPGQVKTPNAPPGQEKTPKPDQPPPGQEKTPKPKK